MASGDSEGESRGVDSGGDSPSDPETTPKPSPGPSDKFEILFYKEQAARCRAEKEAAEAKLAAALAKVGSAGPTPSSTSSTALSGRRAREQEWDSLDYVCIGDFVGNPHLAPDPRVGLVNPDRPQAFSLYGCKISAALEGQKSALKYEYQILAPLLYYFWGAQQFGHDYLEGEIARENSTAEERISLLRPYLNSLDRIYEWFLARKELLELRSGVDGTMGSDPSFLAYAQEQVYDRVGARADDGESWLSDIKDAYRIKFDAARLKSLAAAAAKKGTTAAGSGTPGATGTPRPGGRGRNLKGPKGVSKGVGSPAPAAT